MKSSRTLATYVGDPESQIFVTSRSLFS